MKPSKQAAYEIVIACNHAEKKMGIYFQETGHIQCCCECADKAEEAEKAAKKFDPKVKREKRQQIITSDYMAMMQFSGAMRRKTA